jgi:hypothetical protein
VRQTTLAFSTKAKKEAEEEEADVSMKGSKADKGTMGWNYDYFLWSNFMD